ncbi:MAG: THUMP domain-containing class I SAM-dependent RNA methyltransferase [Planktomarina sp.]
MDTYEIFLVAPPGLEKFVLAEAQERHFPNPEAVPGGVTFQGTLDHVVHANREMRGAVRVLLRVAEFRAMHMAQLDKRARKVPWGDILVRGGKVHVEATCRKSKIYHNKGAAERVANAVLAEVGGEVSNEATVRLKVRIEDDLVTISVDTSGDSLHKRGHKGAVGKAPIRENLAAVCLRACNYQTGEPVVDPMCGSGTFPIEAAEMAIGLHAGRSRSFGYEDLGFKTMAPKAADPQPVAPLFFGYDRDQGAIQSATANAKQAGLGGVVTFTRQAISDLTPPTDKKGLVMINPPYGARIGNKKQLYGLYGALGKTLLEHFGGWRVGLVTSENALAMATGLPWGEPVGPFPNGGLRITLHRCTIPQR